MEDYIQFLIRIQEFIPEILFLSPSYSNTFRAALSTLTMYQPEIVSPTLEFVLATLRHDALSSEVPAPPAPPPPPNYPLFAAAIRGVLAEQGFTLVGLLLGGLLMHFPEESTSTVVTCFRMLAQLFPQQVLAWLPSAIEQIPVASLPAQAKTAFITEYTR